MIDFNKFTQEELATVTSLELKESSYEDISPLKYCTNLKELSIISANAKFLDTSMTDDAKMNYVMKKSKIKDFSVISDLTNLEYLTISYDDNLTELDVSRLKNLFELKLDHNPNLTQLKGLENATGLSKLDLYANGISNSFDLQNLIQNGILSDIQLDFDMYPILRKEHPKISEYLMEQQKNGITCK